MSADALLEVIVTSAADARAAERGGADRLEVVSAIEQGGLTPPVDLLGEITAFASIPVRAMLRARGGFSAGPGEVGELAMAAEKLSAAGAAGFVMGFLSADGSIDAEATGRLAAALDGKPWTFHRAIDHARDPRAALGAVASLSGRGCDTVLAAGSPAGVEAGLDALVAQAAIAPAQGLALMAGGGLRLDHVEPLARAGVRRFHIGSGARARPGWPVEASRVAVWRQAVDR